MLRISTKVDVSVYKISISQACVKQWLTFVSVDFRILVTVTYSVHVEVFQSVIVMFTVETEGPGQYP